MRRALILLRSGLLLVLSAATVHAADVDQQLAERIRRIQADYEAGRQLAIRRVNHSLQIDYAALADRFEAQDRLYREQQALRKKTDRPGESRDPSQPPDGVFSSPDYLRYAEARVMLDQTLERDHLLRARCLQAYEDILDVLIDSDPLFTHFFRSPEYKRRHGLLFTHAVWELVAGESASTVPLNTHTVFADRSHMPFVINVSPAAFSSLAFLRSILIHEINHVLLYKAPIFADVERPSAFPESHPTQPIPGWYSLWFNLKYGRTPAFQYHLLHEYYSFNAQRLYDDAAPRTPSHRLSPSDRAYIDQLATWAARELSEQSRALVTRHPDPPMAAYIQRFVPASSSE